MQRRAAEELDAAGEPGEGARPPVRDPAPGVGKLHETGAGVDRGHRPLGALADAETLVSAPEHHRVAGPVAGRVGERGAAGGERDQPLPLPSGAADNALLDEAVADCRVDLATQGGSVRDHLGGHAR